MSVVEDMQLGLRDPRLLRSVHLERDWTDGYDPSSYVLGSAAADVIERICGAIHPANRIGSGKAFTLTGPYGTGKSALALYLSEYLCGKEERRRAIRHSIVELAQAGVSSMGDSPPMLPVLVTCSGRPLSELILEAIGKISPCRDFGFDPKSGTAVDALANLISVARANGFSGVLIVLDELGKALEFAARNPDKADVYLLQELAEQANRSESPVCILGILHQGFGDYVDELDQSTKTEWAKVQGRFTDIPFLPSEALLARLISGSINCLEVPAVHQREVAQVAEDLCGLEATWMSTIEPANFASICAKSFPLHPTVVAILPILMRRLGQNERSVFAFLAERGLLKSDQDTQMIRLDTVFDYMADWVGFGLRRSTGARSWRLACEILDSRASMEPEEVRLVKVIGLLMSVSSSSRIHPTSSLLSLSLEGGKVPSDRIANALKELRRRSVVTHRRYLDAFVLWQGSDIDLDVEIERARRETHGRTSLAKSLEMTAPLPNLVAMRHSFETGTLRWFVPVYIDEPIDEVLTHQARKGAEGTFVVCLGSTSAQQKAFETLARKSSVSNVVYAISHRTPHLKSLLDELAAMDWVETNVKGLRDDRIAREELAFQRVDLLSQVRMEVSRLTDPSSVNGEECCFWSGGSRLQVKHRRDISRRLSEQFDEVYPQSVIIRNELINRREISSAAAAARRTLVEAMLENPTKDLLGISGYPPERAIYESVLLQSGLHAKKEDGTWQFREPNGADPCRILPVWKYLENLLFDKFPKPISVREVMQSVEAPPFGMVQGLFPLILCAFLIVHSEDVTLYKEGSFVPNPSIAKWELLMRRPELFEIGGCRQTGPRKEVLEQLCASLGVNPPSLLPVVRFLVRTVDNLPQRAKVSRSLKDSTRKLRDTISDARSPESLLFHEAPLALGLTPLGNSVANPLQADEFVVRLRDAFAELTGVVGATKQWAKHVLSEAAGLSRDDEGWRELCRVARDLANEVNDPKVREFCLRLELEDDEQAEASAISLVAMRAIDSWSDADVERFPSQAAIITKELKLEIARTGMDLNPVQRDQSDVLEAKFSAQIFTLLEAGTDRVLVQGVLRRLLRQLEKESNS
jgi:hypothetical protein